LKFFERELKMCRDLYQEEPTCKWVILTLATLIAGLEACKSSSKDDHKAVEEIRQMFDKLIDLDGLRRQYYIDVRTSFLKNIHISE